MPRYCVRFAELLPPAICVAFGLASLAFVISPGDGTWQLYAGLMLHGKRIYTDLGLNQQPIFALLNIVSIKLSDWGIIASKAIFVPIVALYAITLFRLSKLNDLSRLSQSLLVLAVFFVSIRFEAFRFDDYHALSALLAMASLYVSIIFLNGRLSLALFGVGQALLTTTSALTRPNDGIALAAAAASVLVLHHPLNRAFVRMAVVGAAAAGALFLVTLACIHEGPAAWFDNSVLAASGAKGGAGLLRYPGLLVANSFEFVRSALLGKAWPYLLLFCSTLGAGIWMERHLPRLRFLGAALASVTLLLLLTELKLESLIENLAATAALGVIAGFGFGVAAAVKRKIAGTTVEGQPDWSLLAYPFFLFFFGSLSTGGAHYGLYLPVAMSLLVIASVAIRDLGKWRNSTTFRGVFLTLCGLAALLGAAFRWNVPYSWLSYNVPGFSGDYLYRNDKRGLHILPAELAGLVDPVCATITSGKSLLSLPYSFANYYCGIPTWRNYVQTFFDTSTDARISHLMNDLESGPPDFIFYQRQVPVLRAHEVLFNHGAALPHRALDTLIMGKIRSGEWTVIRTSAQYPPSTWLLIATRH